MRLLNSLIKILPTKLVYAHCDIPCGIYDPHEAQMAAHTIIRMVNLINDLKPTSSEPPFDERKKIISQISRFTRVKEEHAQKVEHEIVTLWADYFKQEHFKDYPDLHDLVWKTLKLTGDVRQKIDLEISQKLLANVQQIAEIFWKTKGFEPARILSGYSTEGEIVSHK
ncbi:superoxide dismutase, Ni [Candidatus Daviesbacteria bacterium]|nr:superoxide dismutase, Ni [Candidatus Daviesbacteria bacterium]